MRTINKAQGSLAELSDVRSKARVQLASLEAQHAMFKKHAEDREAYLDGVSANKDLRNQIRSKLPRSIDKDQQLQKIKKALPNNDSAVLLNQFMSTLQSNLTNEADDSILIISALNSLRKQD